MAAPAGPPAGSRPADLGALILVGVLGVALVAGYVVLAALGRDTTGYLLFLGGPAVTGIVGAVLGRRVTAVTAAVETTTAQTRAIVEDSVSDLDNHLSEQDEALNRVALDARAARRAVAPPADAVPAARTPAASPFGPIRSGVVRTDQGE